MALAKAICEALEYEQVGTSQTGINFESGFGRYYIMLITAQVTKEGLDYSSLTLSNVTSCLVCA
jgi:hypothetical protein